MAVFGPDLIDLAKTQAGPDGTFQMSGVEDSDRVVAAARCTDGAVSALVPLPAGDCDVAIVAERPAALEGAVVYAGRPAKAQVVVSPVGEPPRRPGRGSTDNAGRYQVTGLAPGEYRACVYRVLPSFMTGGQPELRRVALSAGQRSREDFELSVGCALEVHLHAGIANQWSSASLFTGDVPGLSRVSDVYAATTARDETTARHANSLSMKDAETVTTFHDVPPGLYTLCAWPTDSARADPTAARVTTLRVVVAEGTSEQRVDLALERH